MMGFGRGWRTGMHGFSGGVVMILFCVLLIIGIVYLVRNISNTSSDSNKRQREDNAINIARERYARGEISKEEYERIIEDLKKPLDN